MSTQDQVREQLRRDVIERAKGRLERGDRNIVLIRSRYRAPGAQKTIAQWRVLCDGANLCLPRELLHLVADEIGEIYGVRFRQESHQIRICDTWYELLIPPAC